MFEITKREIIASISIIAVMLLIGILISGKITESHLDQVEKYNKAAKITDQELFEYGMRTNVGNALVYGELIAADTVTYPEIGGEYMSVEKLEEHYTMHTRTYTTTDSDGNTEEHTETYWTWDKVDSWSKHCEKVTFLGVQFDYGQIYTPHENHIDTQKESYYVRYVYYGSPIKYTGTMFANLKDNKIVDVKFYNGSDLEKTMKGVESNIGVIFFWIAWIMLIIVCIYGFYRLENNWLE